MKILHVNKFLRVVGGSETYMLSVAELQRQAGHETEFFGMEHPDNEEIVGASIGSELHLASAIALDDTKQSIGTKLSAAAAMLWNRDAEQAMADTLDSFKPDIVHMHNIYHQLSPSILRPIKQRHIPTVMTVHDYKLACPSYKLLDNGNLCERCIGEGFRATVQTRCQDGSLAQSALLAIESSLHRKFKAYDPVTLFLCPSEFLLGRLDAAGVFPERLRHLPNFVAPAPAAHPDPNKPPVVLFVGRLSEEKGVDVLVDAASLLKGNAEVVIIGDGPETDALTKRIASSGSPAKLVGRKRPEEVREWLANASALIVPSRWHENQPISILEALSQEVPVISTDLGGLGELVIDNETGFAVPANDAVALAEAIDRLTQDPDTIKKLGKQGAKMVEEYHSTSVHLDALMQRYEEATAMMSAYSTE